MKVSGSVHGTESPSPPKMARTRAWIATSSDDAGLVLQSVTGASHCACSVQMTWHVDSHLRAQYWGA